MQCSECALEVTPENCPMCVLDNVSVREWRAWIAYVLGCSCVWRRYAFSYYAHDTVTSLPKKDPNLKGMRFNPKW